MCFSNSFCDSITGLFPVNGERRLRLEYFLCVWNNLTKGRVDFKNYGMFLSIAETESSVTELKLKGICFNGPRKMKNKTQFLVHLKWISFVRYMATHNGKEFWLISLKPRTQLQWYFLSYVYMLYKILNSNSIRLVIKHTFLKINQKACRKKDPLDKDLSNGFGFAVVR